MRGGSPRRDNRDPIIVILAAVATVLIGSILGFIISGGLSDDQDATPTSLAPTTLAPTTLAPTTLAPTTTDPDSALPPATIGGTSMVLAGAGDISACDNEGDTITAGLIDRVVADYPTAIVYTTGDNVYPDGAPDEFAQCYDPTWGRHKDRTRPSPGNHDYITEGAAGYFGYFGEAAGEPDQGYYAYMAGNWQVISLNSNCDEVACSAGSPQERWLREQLEASNATCTLAYWHHPLFSSGSHGGDESVRDLFAALYEAGAEVVATGHDHNYERFAPQDPVGIQDPVAGIRQFVVGTGGTGNRDAGAPAPNSEAIHTDSFGILKFSLDAEGYEWEYVAEAGSSFDDRGSGACH